MTRAAGAGCIASVVQATPFKRLGRSEALAVVVAFFASPKASFITGHVIVVDGG